MSDKQQPTNDPLEEAVTAFEQMPVPDRPPDASALARLAACDPTRPAPVPTSPRRRYLMRIVVPSTAAIVLLGGAALFLLSGTPAPTLADVRKAAEKHKLVKYKETQTTDTKDLVGATTESTVYADLKALRFRRENRHQFMDPDDREKFIEEFHVSIQDTPNDRLLMTSTHSGGKVLPPRKEAWLGRLGDDRKKWKSFLENLQEFQQKKGVVCVKDKLGGLDALKYHFEEGKLSVSLWVDAKTTLPVRMEYEVSDPTADIVLRNKIVQTDFEWDPELPKGFKNLDVLFDPTPPKGYELTDKTKER